MNGIGPGKRHAKKKMKIEKEKEKKKKKPSLSGKISTIAPYHIGFLPIP